MRKVLKRTVAAVAILLGLSVVVVGATFYYLTDGYCARLVERTQDPAVQRELESWVAVNWTGARVPLDSVLSGDGIVPGERWRPAEFDGSLLGMGPSAHVRLLGPSARDLLDDRLAEHVEAIYFTERSRYGVAVEVPGRDSFGVVPTTPFALTAVSDRVAVICEQ